MLRLFALFSLVAAAISGCNLTVPPHSDVAAALDGDDPQIAKELTSAPAPALSIPADEPPPIDTTVPAKPAPDPCRDDYPGPSRRINADLRINYETKSVGADARITFVNREDGPLTEIVLDAQANQWENGFQLTAIAVDDEPASYDILLNRLRVALLEPLNAGCEVELALAFSLHPPSIRDGLSAYRGFFGYSPRQLNLGHFLPTVAARRGGHWLLHEPLGIGEQVVHEIADWQVRVTVANARESLQLAAPGLVTAISPAAWEIQLTNSRDFAISLSEEFVVTEAVSATGVTVTVYAFADALIDAGGLWLDGAEHAANESVRALDLYSRAFGPYPYARLALVQGDFPDGMEFTGLVFVGSAWFTNFDGTAYNYLTLISVHEIAHQWWYAQVGNDAALAPWLDEALATYSEYLYIEEYHPAYKNWWWTFRVANFFPQGMVDSAVYEFTTARAYINAVYLRGVQMLHNLREDIGEAAFFDLLRAYYAAGAGRIAAPTLFWDQLTTEQISLTNDTRAGFLRQPDVDGMRAELPPERTENAPPSDGGSS